MGMQRVKSPFVKFNAPRQNIEECVQSGMKYFKENKPEAA